MSFTRKLGFLAVTALAAAGLVSAPAAAAPVQPKPTSIKFAAIAVQPGAAVAQDDPPIFECEWKYGPGDPMGQPVINYSAEFNCGMGPNPLSEIQAKLYSAKNVVEHIAPKDGPLLNGAVTSRGSFHGPRIGSQHYVRALSRVELIPDPDGTKFWWYRLPEGCSGLGTYIATCDFKTAVFTYQ